MTRDRKIIFIIAMVMASIIVATAFFIQRRYFSDSLYYTGPVGYDFLTRVKEYPPGTLKRIVVDSTGGDIPAAVSIAKIVQANDIQIVVDGYCLSACAEIILAAGKNNIIKPGSLIAFHNVAGLWFYLDKYTRKTYDLNLENAAIYPYAKEAIKIYEKSGINPDFFVAVTLKKGVVCLGNISNKSQSPVKDGVFVRFSSQLYVPNEKVLGQFGWKFKELNLPKNDEEFDNLINPLLKKNPNENFKIENKNYKFPEFFANGDLEFTYFEEC